MDKTLDEEIAQAKEQIVMSEPSAVKTKEVDSLMVSGKKAFIFGIFGLALGYFCHRLVLLYDSLPNQPPLERLAYLLGEGQNHVLNPLWNGNLYR